MERRKFVIGLGSLAAGGAAATGTGAFGQAQLDGREADIGVSNDTNALVQLIPGHKADDGEGWDSSVADDRVYINNNGQLEISFSDDEGGSGVNPNSTYQVGAIGDRAADQLDGAADGEVLYGGGVEGTSDSTADDDTSDDPAFFLRNASDSRLQVVLTYEADTAPTDDSGVTTDDAVGYFVTDIAGSDVSQGSTVDPEAAALSLDSGGGAAGRARIYIDSGAQLGVSLITRVDDISPDVTAWSGDLQINATDANDVAPNPDAQ